MKEEIENALSSYKYDVELLIDRLQQPLFNLMKMMTSNKKYWGGCEILIELNKHYDFIKPVINSYIADSILEIAKQEEDDES